MKLDAQEIVDLVNETERDRATWAEAAQVWEQDWRLWRYSDNPETHREMDGVTPAVSPDPFNTVQLLQRFVADEIRTEIPTISEKEDDDDRSESLEEFVVAFETVSGRQQGRNLIADKTWYSGVRGRGAAQILWIDDVLEDAGLQGSRLPILKRNLDPFNVGIGRGPYWTDFGYHKYKTSRSDIEQRYPKYKFEGDANSRYQHREYYKEKHTVIDFYSRHSGSILHGVVIDGKFAKPLKKTDYPDVPIIEWYADGAPIKDEFARSLSILHPIHELWKLKCRLMSAVATGMDYHYNPLMVAKGIPEGVNLKAGPGETVYLGLNQSLEAFRAEPNVPMAEKLLAMIQVGIDQATFPSVTFGEAASGSSGYAINSLSQAARSRANTIRSNIEGAMEAEYGLIFAMIEAFAPDDGVQVYGRSSRGDRGRPIKITKKIIKGNYDCRVMLVPEQPMDDNARIMAWLQMVEKNIVSEGLMRNRVLNIATPRDEETRIALQNALKQPQMALKVQLRALQHSYPMDEVERMIVGTELQPVWEAEQQWVEQKEAEAEAEREARRQEKMQAEMQAMMQQQMPPGMPGSMPPPPGMPPSMDPSMGMMGSPGMMGPTTAPPLMPGSNPPGMMPSPGMESMIDPTTGLPPSLNAPSGMGGMQPPGLMGVPPEMAGQMTPEMLGLPPQGGMPGQFDMMMGGPPPSDEELLRQMGGLPPEF